MNDSATQCDDAHIMRACFVIYVTDGKSGMNINNLGALQRSFSALPVSSTYVENLIGNTPLLAIHCHFKSERRTIFAKAEHLPVERKDEGEEGATDETRNEHG